MRVVFTFLVNTIFNLIVGLIVARFLGPEEYGSFALAIAVMIFGQAWPSNGSASAASVSIRSVRGPRHHGLAPRSTPPSGRRPGVRSLGAGARLFGPGNVAAARAGRAGLRRLDRQWPVRLRHRARPRPFRRPAVVRPHRDKEHLSVLGIAGGLGDRVRHRRARRWHGRPARRAGLAPGLKGMRESRRRRSPDRSLAALRRLCRAHRRRHSALQLIPLVNRDLARGSASPRPAVSHSPMISACAPCRRWGPRSTSCCSRSRCAPMIPWRGQGHGRSRAISRSVLRSCCRLASASGSCCPRSRY